MRVVGTLGVLTGESSANLHGRVAQRFWCFCRGNVTADTFLVVDEYNNRPVFKTMRFCPFCGKEAA